MNVRTTPEADGHIRAITVWWVTNRPSAPSMFAEELDGAFETLSIFAKAGGLYHARLGIRRLLLRATRHHVYYVIDELGVLVIAVWGAVKGRPPDLRTLL